MCGIAGIIDASRRDLLARVARMNSVQRHRGPDDEGTWLSGNLALGHVRLAILDTSPAGHQPMHSDCGRYTICYNGEIYNYRELRNTLGRKTSFRSDSDTEVLLRAWQRWGPKCLERLRGMFAFAVYDHDAHRLWLIRDRFGIKPLYYASSGNRFRFASEIKALLADGVPSDPDLGTVGEYLHTALFDHRPRTFFSHVSRLEPGCLLQLDDQGHLLEHRRWYDLARHLPPPPKRFADAREDLLSTLAESVSLHLRSDVPVGVNLSGGIDSSVLLALAHRAWPGDSILTSFTIDFANPRYSEAFWVRSLVGSINADCNFCLATPEGCAASIDAMTWHQDEPFSGIPTLAWYALLGTARQAAVTVLLDGSGIDDCLAGYRPTVFRHLATLHGRKYQSELEGVASVWGVDRKQVELELSRLNKDRGHLEARDSTVPVCPDALHSRVGSPDQFHPDIGDFPDCVVRRDLANSLLFAKIPRALRFKDRNSMAFSRELRVPFLDHVFVEKAMSYPASWMIRHGWNKYILRQAIKGLVPEDVRLAPKRTVQTPQREWFKQPPLSDLLRETLAAPSPLLEEFLDVKIARQCYGRYLAGQDANSNFLWQWLNLDRWYRCCCLKTGQVGNWPQATVSRWHPESRPIMNEER